MERDRIESILESLLFVAGEPLSLKRMDEVISEAPRAEIQEALEELIKKWDAPERGLRISEVAGGYQVQTWTENSPWVGRLLQSRPVRLSRASIETLAIVAYKQPVARAEIEQIRGVDSGGVLKTLLEYGFIKIAGRKDVPGKPLIYATDKKFMEFFRLKSLADLPTLKEMEDIQEERLSEGGSQADLPFDEKEEGQGEATPEEERSEDRAENPETEGEQPAGDPQEEEPSGPENNDGTKEDETRDQ
ncbi:MAG: SMC-Scp complex subunit ScpB [bacterium]